MTTPRPRPLIGSRPIHQGNSPLAFHGKEPRLKLHPPFIIGPRLLPTLRIGNALISIERDGETRDNRDRFRYFIDIDGSEHTDNDLRSGVGGCSIGEAFASLLSFLTHAAESYRPDDRDPRNNRSAGLFDEPVEEWAAAHSDELSGLVFDLESADELISE